MAELLAAVADAVRALGRPDVEVATHDGLVSELVDERTVAVVVPHEYFVLPPAEDPALGARTIAFGVEHPGTEEFETSAEHAAACAARFEISGDSVAELAARGIEARHFPLGYVAGWDRWQRRPVERDVDVVYLGTADERRLAVLARAAQRPGRAAHRAPDPAARADDRGPRPTSWSGPRSGTCWPAARCW